MKLPMEKLMIFVSEIFIDGITNKKIPLVIATSEKRKYNIIDKICHRK